MRVLVMGGSRFTGPSVVDALARRGHEVTVCNRGTRPQPARAVRSIVLDRNDPDALLAAIEPAVYEAIVDMSAYLRTQTESLLDIAGDVERWVHISSGAVYQPPLILPWAESTPYGPWALWGSYAVEKLSCELELRTRRDRPGLSTTCLRFPFVLGPGNYVPREEFVFNRLLDREEILIPGDGRAVFQCLSTGGVAEAVAKAVELGPASWLAANVAEPTFTSLLGFVELAASIAEVEPRIRHVPIPAGPFDAYNAVFPFPSENYVLDTSASVELGIAPVSTTLESVLREALDYLRSHPDRRAWERTAAERVLL